ncbi:MAG: hypothetical protein QOJ26_1924, partial [Thermoplasmata archaeon]|nr:hypothetical protein [Thermoplasmata archaeon]
YAGSGTLTLVADLDPADMDGDGVPDARDADADGDGIDNAIESLVGSDPSDPFSPVPPPPSEVTVCDPPTDGKVTPLDKDGDGTPALYTGRGSTTIHQDGSTTTTPGQCWLAGDPDDDQDHVAAILPPGDGLVAYLTLDMGSGVAVVGAWDGDDVLVTADAFESVDGAYVAYTGPLALYVQRDCGSAQPVVDGVADCQSGSQTVTGLLAPTSQVGNHYGFVVPASAMRQAFVGLPTTAVHFAVQAGSYDSHYNEAKEDLLWAGMQSGAPGAFAAADALESGTFTPVFIVDASAAGGSSVAGGPETADDLWSGILDGVGLGWLAGLF